MLLLCACSNQGEVSSAAKHTFGQLDQDRPQARKRNTCVQNDYEIAGSKGQKQGTTLSMQSEAASYLRSLTTELMTRVNDSLMDEGRKPLFVDHLDPENFCYSIDHSSDLPINASISPLDLSLHLRPASFTHLSGESALASVICHELAHASLFHGQEDIKPEIRKAIIKSNDDERKLARAIDISREFGFLAIDATIVEKVYGKNSRVFLSFEELIKEQTLFINTRLMPFFLGAIVSEHEELNNIFMGHTNFQMFELFKDAHESLMLSSDATNDLNAQELDQWREFALSVKLVFDEDDQYSGTQKLTLYKAMAYLDSISNALNEAYGMGEYAYLNWAETEADDVGLELCIRAGVDSKDFDELHRFSLQNKEQSEKSLSQCLSSIDQGYIPDRSTATHPSSCRRIYDITVKEQSAHSDSYSDLRKRYPVRPLKGPEEFDRIRNLVKSISN